MSVIKDLLLKFETLENKYKILQGKFDKLKIYVDLINTKPKQLPDAFAYKPQQPYIGIGGIDLKLVKEDIEYLTGNRELHKYIESNGRNKVYMTVIELITTSSMMGVVTTQEYHRVVFGGLYENDKYKIFITQSSYTDEDNWTDQRVHYKIYEVMYEFGDLEIL